MPSGERVGPVPVARAYFALQAAGGAAWWVAIAASDDVRRWTLGQWDPVVLLGPDLVLFVGASAVAASRGSRRAAAIAAGWTTAVTAALVVHGLVERAAGAGVVLMAVATAGTLAATATIWSGRVPTRWFFVGPFSFRVADDASGARHLRRSLARGLGLWSCVTMALRGNGTPLPAQTARDLVVAGPYRSVRNPMAVAGALQTAGVGLWVGSWTVIAIPVPRALTSNALIRPEEEAELAARFGAPYQRYAEQVRCWIPTRPWRPA